MQHAIIFGCGRSGTSILGELFEHIDSYKYFFEPALSELAKFDFKGAKLLAAKVPKSPAPECSPGLSCNLDALLEILPTNRTFIFIVRHPLDTICSLKPGIEDGWRHNPKPLEYKKYMDRPLTVRCAHHWENINRAGFEYLKNKVPVHLVKYEDLITNRAQTVSQLLDGLQVPAESRSGIQNYLSLIQDETADSYHAKNQVKWYRDNHSTRMERWKGELSQPELDEILPIVLRTGRRFGYEV